MQLQEALTELNLTPREAQIYTSLLELGEGTPLSLAKRTGFKRPTIYLDLESLRRKQLVGLVPRGKKQVYAPDPPSRLLQRAQQQEQAVRELLPHLRALENRDGKKPLIRYFDQLKDIERVWVEETFQAEENLYISHYLDTLKLFPDLETKSVRQLEKGVVQRQREIHPATPESIQFAQVTKSPHREIRILPKNMNFDIDISLWNDSVALFSNPKRYMLVITDKAIADGFRTMFEATWMVSKKPNELTQPATQRRRGA